jgi:hypothetical protein
MSVAPERERTAVIISSILHLSQKSRCRRPSARLWRTNSCFAPLAFPDNSSRAQRFDPTDSRLGARFVVLMILYSQVSAVNTTEGCEVENNTFEKCLYTILNAPWKHLSSYAYDSVILNCGLEIPKRATLFNLLCLQCCLAYVRVVISILIRVAVFLVNLHSAQCSEQHIYLL